MVRRDATEAFAPEGASAADAGCTSPAGERPVPVGVGAPGITLVIIMTITFWLFEMLPSRPDDLLSPNPLIKPAQKEAMIKLFGYDKPVVERYFIFMKNLLTFDFGISYSQAVSVNSLLGERIPRTIFLFGLSVIISYGLGILIGAYIGWRRGGVADGVSVVSSLIFYNMPSFWIGLIFLVVFSFNLGWFPLTAWPQHYPFTFLDVLHATFLPETG